MHTRTDPWDDDEFDEMTWSPEPSYWRPTKRWALARACRKKTKLEAKLHRESQDRVYEC